jgi:thiol-disulfide isomerase/thioredoxin
MTTQARRPHPLSPVWLAVLAALLLVQTGITQGEVRRFNPPLKAPAFELPGLDGGRHALEDFRGRPLLISVWASWCTPCKIELPEFQRASRELAGPHPDAAFVTVNLGEGGARAKTWAAQHGLRLPILLAGQKFMQDYGLIAIPTILVFDRDGRLAAAHEGWVMNTDLVQELGKDLDALGTRAAN